MQTPLPNTWMKLLATPEKDWSLLEATLVVSDQFRADTDHNEFYSQLQDIERQLAQRISAADDSAQRLQRLNSFFFDELGFKPAKLENFSDLHSFPDQVLQHRTGIPLGLSIIYMLLARHIGMDIQGVNFPGHFILQVGLAGEYRLLDVFDGGRLLDTDELQATLNRHRKQLGGSEDVADYLELADVRAIVMRMLRNLKNIYIEQRESQKALLAIEMILSLDDRAIEEIRDRGMIYHYLEYSVGAMRDLQEYLAVRQDSSERQIIEALIESLETQHTVLH